MHTLHSMKILHRDLKCANIFISKENTAKLGDLNVSKIAKRGLVQTQTGTPYYASPEVWRDQPYGAKSDIWSLGCILYEMATGKPPFRAQDLQGLNRKIQAGKFDPLPQKYSSDLTLIISSCLKVNPELRPSTEDLINNPIIAKKQETGGAGNNNNNQNVQNANKKKISSEDLLQTIVLPKNLKQINMALPKSKYEKKMNFQFEENLDEINIRQNKVQENVASNVTKHERLNSANPSSRSNQIDPIPLIRPNNVSNKPPAQNNQIQKPVQQQQQQQQLQQQQVASSHLPPKNPLKQDQKNLPPSYPQQQQLSNKPNIQIQQQQQVPPKNMVPQTTQNKQQPSIQQQQQQSRPQTQQQQLQSQQQQAQVPQQQRSQQRQMSADRSRDYNAYIQSRQQGNYNFNQQQNTKSNSNNQQQSSQQKISESPQIQGPKYTNQQKQTEQKVFQSQNALPNIQNNKGQQYYYNQQYNQNSQQQQQQQQRGRDKYSQVNNSYDQYQQYKRNASYDNIQRQNVRIQAANNIVSGQNSNLQPNYNANKYQKPVWWG